MEEPILKVKINGFDDRYEMDSNGCFEDIIYEKNLVPRHRTDREDGHFVVKLRIKSRKYKTVKLIDYVYTYFIGPIPEGMQVDCKDENRSNFNKKNLFLKKHRDSRTYKQLYETDYSQYGKPIPDFPDYYASRDGKIFSLVKQQIKENYYDEETCEYERIQLINGEGSKTVYIHRVVYETHTGPLEKNKVIDHINRNKRDNRVENLRQVSSKINALNVSPRKNRETIVHKEGYIGCIIGEDRNFDAKILFLDNEFIIGKYGEDLLLNIKKCCNSLKTQHKGYYWRYLHDDNYILNFAGFYDVETYDDYTFKNYGYMSNENGVIVNKYGKILRKDFKKGYHSISLNTDNGERKNYKIHRLVAMIFIPNPEKLPIVNHIDEKKLNNNFNNLEWVTNKQNVEHSLGVKICQICIKTGVIEIIFKSRTEINETFAKELGFSDIHRGIINACNDKNLYHEFFWKEYEKGDKVGDIINIKLYNKQSSSSNGIKICKISINSGKIKAIYNSYSELSRELGYVNNTPTIKKSCENKTSMYGFYWKLYKKGDGVGEEIDIELYTDIKRKDKIKKEILFNREGIKICKVDKNGKKIVKIYNSYSEASRELDKSNIRSQIKKACEDKTVKYGSYWKIWEKGDIIGKKVKI